MPFRPKYEFFEYPKKPELIVHKEPPPDTDDRFSFGYKSRWSVRSATCQYKTYFFCHHCGGWIEGEPHENEVNTMSPSHPLSGRRGWEFYCLRCGGEIGFSGMVS